MKKVWDKWTRIALVKRILVGLILGAILGIAVPQATGIAILGLDHTQADPRAGTLRFPERGHMELRCSQTHDRPHCGKRLARRAQGREPKDLHSCTGAAHIRH